MAAVTSGVQGQAPSEAQLGPAVAPDRPPGMRSEGVEALGHPEKLRS
jgi:hypothetical protein